MANNHGERPIGAIIRNVVIHTNQGPHSSSSAGDPSAESLAHYLDSTAATPDPVSYHVLVDDDSVVTYLPDSAESWSAFNSNPIGLHLCFIGYAEWSRDEWLRHRRMLQMGADRVAQWCSLHRIPLKKLVPQEVVNKDWGVIGHADWTYASKMINPKSPDSHTDPGPGFPWDVFIQLVSKGKKMGGLVIVQLPATEAPPAKTARKDWPQREEIVHLGYVRGWNGRVNLHCAVNNPGGFLYRAHVDYPNGSGKAATIISWIDPTKNESMEMFPPWQSDRDYSFEPQKEGPGVLMITYAAPSGLCLAIELET